MRGKHPCFEESACSTSGRVHLPVAPECNTACNFCNRKYDCPNEGRPGVSSAILQPEHALVYLEEIAQRIPLDVIGIAGPGDALANHKKVFTTLAAVRQAYPDVSFCMATNGLALPDHVDRLSELGVDYMTVTVNAATAATGARIYRWVRKEKRIFRGEEGAEMMLENQLLGIRALKKRGITVKVNTVLIPEVNDYEAEAIAELAATAGADVMNILPVMPVAGTPFADVTPPAAAELDSIRRKCGTQIAQITHCRRCRADAAGTLTGGLDAAAVADLLREASSGGRPKRVAVASREGMLVNQHVGEAESFLIYELAGTDPRLVEHREAPESGCGSERWERLAELLADCRWIAATGIGEKPREQLAASGLQSVLVSGTVNEAAGLILRGEEYSHLAVNNFSCTGGGVNCA